MKQLFVIIVVGLLSIGGGVAFRYFYHSSLSWKQEYEIRKQDQFRNNNSIHAVDTKALTAEKIRQLKMNPDGGGFAGSPEELKSIVSDFVADNSKSDSTYLYIASGTAYKIGEIKEAAFLFYAAQVRKSFDYKRYGLDKTDVNGNNIQTVLGALNQTIGEYVNPAIIRKPQEFSEVIDMIGKWQVIPADDALYPKESYGSYVISKDQWPTLAEQVKQSFMDNFGNKYKKILSDPKIAKAFYFVQDFNLGKIPFNSENAKKYQEYTKVINSAEIQ